MGLDFFLWGGSNFVTSKEVSRRRHLGRKPQVAENGENPAERKSQPEKEKGKMRSAERPNKTQNYVLQFRPSSSIEHDVCSLREGEPLSRLFPIYQSKQHKPHRELKGK
jgi:hypothetical protein